MQLLVATVLALVAAIGADKCSCPAGWTNYEFNCYIAYVDTKLTWEDARDFCRETVPGADLVTINSTKENVFLLNEFGKKGYWIGLSNINNDGTFTWSSGEPVTYQNWIPGQPDGSGSCVHINDYTGGGWSDWTCGTDYQFICQTSMSSL